MLSDISNSTAQLSMASHQVLEVEGVSSSQPYILISKAEPVPGCSRWAPGSTGFPCNFTFSFIFLVFEFPVSCSSNPWIFTFPRG